MLRLGRCVLGSERRGIAAAVEVVVAAHPPQVRILGARADVARTHGSPRALGETRYGAGARVGQSLAHQRGSTGRGRRVENRSVIPRRSRTRRPMRPASRRPLQVLVRCEHRRRVLRAHPINQGPAAALPVSRRVMSMELGANLPKNPGSRAAIWETAARRWMSAARRQVQLDSLVPRQRRQPAPCAYCAPPWGWTDRVPNRSILASPSPPFGRRSGSRGFRAA